MRDGKVLRRVGIVERAGVYYIGRAGQHTQHGGGQRGWLTKGTSMLLHLLRTLIEHSAKDKFSSKFLFDRNTFLEATQGFHSDSAIQVLLNPTNGKL